MGGAILRRRQRLQHGNTLPTPRARALLRDLELSDSAYFRADHFLYMNGRKSTVRPWPSVAASRGTVAAGAVPGSALRDRRRGPPAGRPPLARRGPAARPAPLGALPESQSGPLVRRQRRHHRAALAARRGRRHVHGGHGRHAGHHGPPGSRRARRLLASPSPPTPTSPSSPTRTSASAWTCPGR